MRTISETKPKLSIQNTQALLYDQGYTYNESGFIYNQPNVAYGGVYGLDIMSIVATATSEKSINQSIGDFQNTLPIKKFTRGMSMGLLLDLTYRNAFIIYL